MHRGNVGELHTKPHWLAIGSVDGLPPRLNIVRTSAWHTRHHRLAIGQADAIIIPAKYRENVYGLHPRRHWVNIDDIDGKDTPANYRENVYGLHPKPRRYNSAN